jgi:tRNA (cmo5U34)-methyltransferase
MIHPPLPFDPTQYFDQGVAARYDQGIRLSCPSYDALHRMLAPLLRSLPEEARFLCAGAGTGAEIAALADRFARWRFVGVDVSASMLAVCRNRILQAAIADRVNLHQGRMEDYQGPALCDAASSIFVAHFIQSADERRAYFRALAANLKPGALLVIADLFGDKGSPEFIRLMEAWLVYYVSNGAIAEKLTQDLQHIFTNIVFAPEHELIAMLEECGFCNVVRFFQSFLFGGWVARKRE